MYVILLSGGSGKRLWPLSNALRSKQYIKLLTDGQSSGPCSMIQRVWGQLTDAGLVKNSIICASRAQVEVIKSQLEDVGIAIESTRRDTFPAVALSCAYLKDKLGASDEDVVCVLPVDPYTDATFFETLKRLPKILETSGAEVVLIGAKPAEPSGKYGYIIPAEDAGTYIKVDSFREKPSESAAKELIGRGALWNCGVFCLRVGDVLRLLPKYDAPSNYDALYDQYGLLPKISFDYEVLEKSRKLAAVTFEGLWKDLGTWDALSAEMGETAVGNCVLDASCKNTHVVNELDIPLVVTGVRDLMIVASYDGILVADKERTHQIRDLVEDLDRPPMYEERIWGTIKVLDIFQMHSGQYNATRKLQIFKGQSLQYHCHDRRDEIWTILGGEAEFNIDGEHQDLWAGASIRISRGTWHSVYAKTELIALEVQVGERIGDQDIHHVAFEWDGSNRRPFDTVLGAQGERD